MFVTILFFLQIACDPSKLQGLYGSAGPSGGIGSRHGNVHHGNTHVEQDHHDNAHGEQDSHDRHHNVHDDIIQQDFDRLFPDYDTRFLDESIERSLEGHVHHEDSNVHHDHLNAGNVDDGHVHSGDEATSTGRSFTLPKLPKVDLVGDVTTVNIDNGHIHSGDHSTLTGRSFTLPKLPKFNVVGDVTTVTVDSGITITEVVTKDFFSTVTNVIYNSIPVTLTDFVKSTVSAPVTTVCFGSFSCIYF